MTKHTYDLIELRELDDDAVAGGFSDTLEARFARDALGCERIGLSLQRVKPGARAPFAHRHSDDEEVYVVVAGDGRAVVEGDTLLLDLVGPDNDHSWRSRTVARVADAMVFDGLPSADRCADRTAV